MSSFNAMPSPVKTPDSPQSEQLDIPSPISFSELSPSQLNDLSMDEAPLLPAFLSPPLPPASPNLAGPSLKPDPSSQKASPNDTTSELVKRLKLLSPAELIIVVKNIEKRFHYLNAIELIEMRRSRRLGYACSSHLPTQ